VNACVVFKLSRVIPSGGCSYVRKQSNACTVLHTSSADRLLIKSERASVWRKGTPPLFQSQTQSRFPMVFPNGFLLKLVDEGKVFYIYQNNKLFLNLYPTRLKRVFVGKDEDGEYYIFRFEGKEVSVSKRKYEL